MNEIWKDIPGYENLYQASNFGRIRSLNYKGKNRIKILKTPANNLQRPCVNLFKNGKHKQYKSYQLVLMAFRGFPQYGEECLHIDDNVKNNNINNLKWGSRSENCRQMFSHNRKTLKGENHNQAKLGYSAIYRIRMINENIKPKRGYWEKLRKAIGISKSHIHKIKNYQKWNTAIIPSA